MVTASELVSYADARAIIVSEAKPLEIQAIPVGVAAGYFLAETFVAAADNPRFDNSQVDGYALHSSDLAADERQLRIVGEIAAGPFASDQRLERGTTIAVMTGAPLPINTSAVVMHEETRVLAGAIVLEVPQRTGANIRRRGEEYCAGTSLVMAGSHVDAACVATLASQGTSRISAFKKPKIAIVTTGDEVQVVDTNLNAGEIYDANGPGLVSALLQLGIEDVTVAHARDTVEACRRVLSDAIEDADVVITSGGVSVGKFDPVRAALDELQVKEIFWRVAIKPGKPFFFGRCDTGRARHVFGLPGNPLATLVTFRTLVVPYLARIMGAEDVSERVSLLPLARGVRKAVGRLEFVPCLLDSNGELETTERRGSHMLSGLIGVDRLALLPAEAQDLPQGTRVSSIPWSFR